MSRWPTITELRQGASPSVAAAIDAELARRSGRPAPSPRPAAPVAGPSGPVMNKTETRYQQQLEAEKLAGAVRAYRFGSVTLKLADDCRFTPDFWVLMADGSTEFREVKGFWREDARIKIKVAAALFPYRFSAVRWVKGQWHVETF